MNQPCGQKEMCHLDFREDCTRCGWNPVVNELRHEAVRKGQLHKNEKGLLSLNVGNIRGGFRMEG